MGDVLTWPVGHARNENSPDTRAPGGPPLAYALGTTIAGTATAASVSSIGALVGADSDSVVGILALSIAGMAVFLQLTPLTSAVLPPRHRQVPRSWLDWRSQSATAFGWGLLIGCGFWTSLRFAVAYALAVALMVLPVGSALLIGGVYGATRGVTLLVTWMCDRTHTSRVPWERLASNRSICVGLSLTGAAVVGLIAISTPYS